MCNPHPPSTPAPVYRRARRLPISSAIDVEAVELDTTDATSPVTSLRPAPAANKPVWFAPSGQPESEDYGTPLVGRPDELGASYDDATGATNFALYSSSATGVTLVLFNETCMAHGQTLYEIPLDKDANRTGHVWHIMLPLLNTDLLYGYRVSGPHQDSQPDSQGHRHNQNMVVLDPYAKAILSRRSYGLLGADIDYTSPDVLGYAETWPQAACAVPYPPDYDEFDWCGDQPLNIPMEQLVIYEMHVRGFTQHPSSQVEAAGTYAGMIEKLDHLAALGVNAVELLPVQEFNELEYYTPIPGSDPPAYRFNFWGYSTLGFFAPMSRYSANIAAGGPPLSLAYEFKTLVRECHARGIEVILDVVFNHTAEGNDKGLTLSFRGIDNRTYYMLAPGGEYYNYSGCGNTLNCNQPAVRQFITQCLRYWVTEYHVDGFRFDLASILTRAHSAWHPSTDPLTGEALGGPHGPVVDSATGLMTNGSGVPTGTPLADPPLIEMISEDPVLRNTKLIAEAWDCDGLNQVGAFPHYGGRWAEWNGRFRDTVRNFIKGMDGWAGPFASALCGSPDLYASTQAPETDWWSTNSGRRWRGNRTPTASINFITAHDGFTLADLVAYNDKHNQANGEGNQDGENHNNSWNCGEEGDTQKWNVKRLRQRQMRNLCVALLVAHGVPMITMGDEYAHTKRGNNNTYCHDDPLNWFNWEESEADEGGFQRFMRCMVNFRRSRPELLRSTFVSAKDVQWHGELPDSPDWSEASRLVACTINDGAGNGLYVAFNTGHTARALKLPKWPGKVWQRVADTSQLAPFDFLAADEVMSPEELARAQAASLMWSADHHAAMLPWSALILESVPESAVEAMKAPEP
ncbi:isoamylase [Haematococcus lacustris]